MVTTVTSNNCTDDSIIDVTGQSYTINPDTNLEKCNVPHWPHRYIYTASEISTASAAQKEFYEIFRSKFVNHKCLDIEGSSNYAFILMFDLIEAFGGHGNIFVTGEQMHRLSQNYPETKRYAYKTLINRFEESGEYDAAWELRKKYRCFDIFSPARAKEDTRNGANQWRIGTKFKAQLKLTDDEVALFDGLGDINNNFCNIEYCCIQVIKFYLITMSKLTKVYSLEGTSAEAEFLSVADIIATRHFKYRHGSENYQYGVQTITRELYSLIFRHCENAVREHYGHKRKVSVESGYTTPEAKAQFEDRIMTRVTAIIAEKISKVAPPDEAAEIELNSRNTNRWKIKFESLTAGFSGNVEEFTASIMALAELNRKNPSVENIFFEASKFIAKYDRQTALSLYIHYLHHDLKSEVFDNRQLTRAIQKNLFTTDVQLREFELVVSELIKNNNLHKALQAVPGIYAVKRKKIQLDSASIIEVQQQHAGTVELLNEYLSDGSEDEDSAIRSQEAGNDEIKFEIISTSEETARHAFLPGLAFTEVHITVLGLFAKSNFSVSQSEMEAFARSRGVFKNQLVESINDACYEFLDDVLIEEDEDYYTININYYQNLSAK